MDKDLNCQNTKDWAMAGNLLVDLSSMEKGFFEVKRYRQEVWEYIEYRESLVKWPPMNERIRGGAL